MTVNIGNIAAARSLLKESTGLSQKTDAQGSSNEFLLLMGSSEEILEEASIVNNPGLLPVELTNQSEHHLDGELSKMASEQSLLSLNEIELERPVSPDTVELLDVTPQKIVAEIVELNNNQENSQMALDEQPEEELLQPNASFDEVPKNVKLVQDALIVQNKTKKPIIEDKTIASEAIIPTAAAQDVVTDELNKSPQLITEPPVNNQPIKDQKKNTSSELDILPFTIQQVATIEVRQPVEKANIVSSSPAPMMENATSETNQNTKDGHDYGSSGGGDLLNITEEVTKKEEKGALLELSKANKPENMLQNASLEVVKSDIESYGGRVSITSEGKLEVSFPKQFVLEGGSIPPKDKQIELPIKLAHSADKKEISIKLFPETLGRVDIKIKYSNNANGSAIENIRISAAENSLSALEASSAQLKDAIKHLMSNEVKASEQTVIFSSSRGGGGLNQEAGENNQYQTNEDREHWMTLFTNNKNITPEKEGGEKTSIRPSSSTSTNIDIEV